MLPRILTYLLESRLRYLFLAAGITLAFAKLLTETNAAPGAWAPDLLLYQDWIHKATASGPGLSYDWVYPYLAALPMRMSVLVIDVLSTTPRIGNLPNVHAALAWFPLFATLTLLAILILLITTRGHRRAFAAAWLWIGFMLALGPISWTRIDVIATALAAMSVGLLAAPTYRKTLSPTTQRVLLIAAVVLAVVGAWIKIWPVALVLTLAVVTPPNFTIRLSRTITLITAAATNLAIIAAGILAGGSLQHMLSFVTTQNDRGLQLEGVFSSPWLAGAVSNQPGFSIYLNEAISTYEVKGPGSSSILALLSPLLLLTILLIAALAVRADRRQHPDLFTWVFLATTTSLIVFNKVGSPQFVSWLAVPLLAGILLSSSRWLTPGVTIFLIAELTRYSMQYFYLTYNQPLAAALTITRNILEIVLLIYALTRIIKPGLPDKQKGTLPQEDAFPVESGQSVPQPR